MGFGLHFGWGIEGAIGKSNKFFVFLIFFKGSEFKIDASYLSPNVNMAERL